MASFFTEHLPVAASGFCVYFLLELKRVDVHLKKKKKKKKEIFQRDIKENSNNLVQSQEQITVSGIPPVNVRAVPVKVEYRTKTAAVENGPLMKSWN